MVRGCAALRVRANDGGKKRTLLLPGTAFFQRFLLHVITTARAPQRIHTYYTGSDGMHYMSNVRPGNYLLLVNGTLRFPLPVNNVPLQDIPPILFSY